LVTENCIRCKFQDCDDNGTQWADFNSKYTQLWPVITGKGEEPVDAQEYMNIEGKLEKHFDPRPGNGG
jgi:ferredoxin